MDNDINKEMREFREEIADSLGHEKKDENIRRSKASLGFKYPLILGGAGIIILIVLIFLFPWDKNKVSIKDLTSIKVRLDLLERRLTRIEGVEVKIAHLEKQGKGFQQYMAERERYGRYLTQRLDKLTQRTDRLEKGMTPVAAKTKAQKATQRKPTSLAKKPYHKVRRGENLYRIAQQYGISVEELCRLNNITSKQAIYPGQKLLVSPKSNQ
jgi:LysM repeat protein